MALLWPSSRSTERGEMAARMAELGQLATPIGPVASWPDTLRTAVDICLGSRFPIGVFWGDSLPQFYNDAYRPILGEHKHPQFLGQPLADCWPEIWDTVGPMLQQVLVTGEATWSEDLLLPMLRNGFLEDAYFTFSYSPIDDRAQ